MFYRGSRSNTSLWDDRNYSKGLSYNYSTDLSLSSRSPRNPSLQRVINSEYVRPDRSLSPSRDHSSSSRLNSYRSLSSTVSSDASPTIRRRDASPSVTFSDSRSSPVSVLNDDLCYSSKPRHYYDFPSSTTGLFTSYTSTIKKPKRIDYSDYLRPVLSDRPMLKTGYVPRSRADRGDNVNPLIRERKLIKFRETSDEVLEKIRRRISWDLPEEISSPLIDEMKQNSHEFSEDIAESELEQNEGNSSRRCSKDIASPISGSPRPSISRRSSVDQCLDITARNPIRKNSKSNSLICSSIDSAHDNFSSKPEDMHLFPKAPIPPPRKKSVGSTHKLRKSRKTSVEILLSDEKTQNYSKIAADIRRNREIVETKKKLTEEESTKEKSQVFKDEIEAANADSTSMADPTELTSDRGRRRRRQKSIPEFDQPEEKPHEARRRRSRITTGSNSPPTDTMHISEDKFIDAPRPVSRMHRKSVKYKYDAQSGGRSSKDSGGLSDSVSSQKVSSTVVDLKVTNESMVKSDKQKCDKETTEILSNQNINVDSKVKKDQKLHSGESAEKSKLESIICPLDKKTDRLLVQSKAEALKLDNKRVAEKNISQEIKKTDLKITPTDKNCKIQEKETEMKHCLNKTMPEPNVTMPTEIPSCKINDINESESATKPKLKQEISPADKKTEKILTKSKAKDLKLDNKPVVEKKEKGKTDLKTTSTDKISKIKEKETEMKQCSNKISKTNGTMTTEISRSKINDAKESEMNRLNKLKDEYKTPVEKSVFDSKSHETEKKETLKSDLNKKNYKIEEKSDLKHEVNGSSFGVDTIKTNCEATHKSSENENVSGLKRSKIETKALNERTPKVELEDRKVNEIKNIAVKQPLDINNTIDATSTNQQKNFVSKINADKLQSREIEEVVVVCKLPQTKRIDLELSKKTFPVEQNVVVSIKSAVIKTVNATQNSRDLSTAPKVLAIIPSNFSKDSKIAIRDNKKCPEISEASDVNVTHTVVLKPKLQSKSSYIQVTKSEKVKEDIVRLKPIPDVIKSAVNYTAKVTDDVSDVVRSTLSKGTDQPKREIPVLPCIKNEECDKNLVNNSKQPTLQDKYFVPEITSDGKEKILGENDLENNLTLSKEVPKSKDFVNKKQFSFGARDDAKETVSKAFSNHKESSSHILDNKERIKDIVSMKPDLIQMTAKTIEDESLAGISKSVSNQNLHADDKKTFEIRNNVESIKDELKVKNDINNFASTAALSEKETKENELKDAVEKNKICVNDKSDFKKIKADDSIIAKQKHELEKPNDCKKFSTNNKVILPLSGISSILKSANEEKDRKPISERKEEKNKKNEDCSKHLPEVENILNAKFNSKMIEIAKQKPESEKNQPEDKNIIAEINNNKKLAVSIEKISGKTETNFNSKVLDAKISENKQNSRQQHEDCKKNFSQLDLKKEKEKYALENLKNKGMVAKKESEFQRNQLESIDTVQSDNKKEKVNTSDISPIEKTDTKENLISKIEFVGKIFESKELRNEKQRENKITLPELEVKKSIETDNLKIDNEMKKNKQAIPAYKKSMTSPDISILNEEVLTAAKAGKLNTTLSADNVPITLDEKFLVQNYKSKQDIKDKNVTKEVFKTNGKTDNGAVTSFSNKNSFDSSPGLPKIDFNEVKSVQKDLKPSNKMKAIPKMYISSNKLDADSTTDKEKKKSDRESKLNPDNINNCNIDKILPTVPEAKGLSNSAEENSLVKNRKITSPKFSNTTSAEKYKLQSEIEKLPVLESLEKNKTDSSDKRLARSVVLQEKFIEDSVSDKLVSEQKTERQTVDEIKVTNEPRQPKKEKPQTLPAIPPPFKRYGLFVRPKEPPKTILETSSDEETETESSEEETESSEEETEPAVNKISKLTNECNVTCHQKCEKYMPNLCGVNQKLLSEVLDKVKKGKCPDQYEKTRTRSETSNASIHSTLSNSTTCSILPSWDDDGSPKRTDKTKKLKFRKYGIGDFAFLKLLGKGSFGKVLLAELKESDMYFAIKCLKKDVVLEDDDVESTMIERRVLALGTQHPYMCKLYCTFQTESYLYFVMEYLNGGDLMFHIQEKGRFEEKRAVFYGAEIVSALKFLHKRGIVYRDIKLDNVMLDEQGHVRLVDFGMCQCRIYKEECMPSNFCGTPTYIAPEVDIKLDNIILDEDGHVHLVDFGMCKTGIVESVKTSTFCGTPDYIPPEIVLGKTYNESVDWWSFGVLLYEMLIGRSPFQGTDEDELFWSICNEEPQYPRFLSKQATHILGLLLVKAPSNRLGMPSCPGGDIKDHAFFSTINWDKIEKKELPPSFKPKVSCPSDTSNFDSSFTKESASLEVIESEVLKSMDQQQFNGFSYTNPHLTG